MELVNAFYESPFPEALFKIFNETEDHGNDHLQEEKQVCTKGKGV